MRSFSYFTDTLDNYSLHFGTELEVYYLSSINIYTLDRRYTPFTQEALAHASST